MTRTCLPPKQKKPKRSTVITLKTKNFLLRLHRSNPELNNDLTDDDCKTVFGLSRKEVLEEEVLEEEVLEDEVLEEEVLDTTKPVDLNENIVEALDLDLDLVLIPDIEPNLGDYMLDMFD